MTTDLKASTVSGIKWSSVSQFSRQVFQFVTTLILVSLLSPADFGLMAMALILINFLEIFKDLGTSAALIHLESPSATLKSSIFWINFALGIIITALIIITAPLFALFFNSDAVTDVLRVLSVTFLIAGVSIVQKTLLEKSLLFQPIAKVELTASIISFCVAIYLAYQGFGVWSLVFQVITNSVISSLMLWHYSEWKPALQMNYKEVKSISYFSVNLIGFNIINYFARNSDYFLIGKFLGDKALGHYYLAYRIMLYPIQNITAVISRVIFPSFSKIQTDNMKLRDVYVKITNTIALVTFPLMAGLAALSFNFVNAFLGGQWDIKLVAVLITILAPVGALQSIVSTVGSLYQAKGRTDWMLRWSIFATIIIVSGFLIGMRWGVVGVAVSYLITNSILLYPVFAIPFRLIELNTFYFFKSFSNTLITVLCMIFVLILFNSLFTGISHAIIRFIILTAAGVIVYFALSLLLNKKNLMLLKEINPGVVKNRA